MNRLHKRMKLRMKLLRQQSRMKIRMHLLKPNQSVLRNTQISKINQRRIPCKILLRRLFKNRLRIQCKNKSRNKKQRKLWRKPKSHIIKSSKMTNRLQILKLRTHNKRILQLRMNKVRRMTVLKINKVKSRPRMLSWRIKLTLSRMEKMRLLCPNKRTTLQSKIKNNLLRLKCRMMQKEALGKLRLKLKLKLPRPP